MEEKKSTEPNISETSSEKPKKVKKRRMWRKGEWRRPKVKKKKPKKKKSVAKSVDYYILITNFGKQVKMVKHLKTRGSIISLYDKMLTENNKVKFPVKYVNLKEITESDYELMLVRNYDDEMDVQPSRIMNAPMKDLKYRIIRREPYMIEERFKMYGYDSMDERKTIDEIVDILKSKETYNRELGILQNKVLIFNEEEFDMIMTKCRDDGLRLGRQLYNELDNYKDFFYKGEYKGWEKIEILDIIEDFTGWDRRKIKRNKQNG